MRITIIYDNEVWKKGLKADWGFSCLIEVYGKNILFDTGANANILLWNMAKLDIDPTIIDEVVISHAHWDHTGGLLDFLNINPCRVYIPLSCPAPPGGGEVIKVKGPLEIYENIFSTGELSGIEQSLIVKTEAGLVVIAGCSHPGVREIFREASRLGKIIALIGGLHGFNEFNIVRDLEKICPTHCTQYKKEIKALYPDKYLEGGVGKVIEI
ncbi:MAG: MBL fold metallo-hydrolase [Deltaproteobacteria bacterium]|nr:MBL fold metallo-hydrolase [Deltaproteobacteria bacterium]MBW1728043.1 MBL fold metallo-hydrolase [Deltaproteobacteria bacterium]MBW1910948.1 MBL fold metallo-hydrolase [Deltaproteobacteria bacterium]MBW2034977.1 MBL fold metallo-hydrolase [Deltaproteobacteria bacterium]MBW2168127.1 MBL fold metallo-hydrolase [Deltaproteobacteria bacterium]